jgi:hypothetical protein
VLAVLSFVDIGALAMRPVLAAGLIVLAALLLYRRGSVRRLTGDAGIAVDFTIAVLILLAVPNLLVFDTADLYQTQVVHFHQDLFLGPADHVLGGGTLLIDTLSQYGVGSIYLIVGWFQLAPIGDGTLGFLDNVLSALVFVSAFAVLRLTGASRLLAATAMAVAVVAFVFGLDLPLGALLQHGAIRFGMPILIILAATLEFAHPRWRRPAQVVQVLTIGLSSIWALEAFGYTVFTAAVVLALRLWLVPGAFRRRTLGRWVAAALAAALAFHVALALGTLIAAGQLPRWGWYLNTLREFLSGGIGDLTYDFARWTPAFPLGAFYVVAVAAFVLLLRLHPERVHRRPEQAVALVATTAWGIALYSYFVNRSADHILPYISLPAVMVSAIWLAVLLEPAAGVTLRARLAGLAAALAAALLLVGAAWTQAGPRLSESALAHVAPGGETLGAAMRRLWHPPDLSPGATEGAALAERCIEDPDRTYVITQPDLGIEILTKLDRANAFPLSNPWEDSWVATTFLDEVADSVADLRAGDRMLVDKSALDVLAAYRRDPDRSPLTDAVAPTGLASLQEWLLKEIGRRYRLRTVCRAPGELSLRVVELQPRS